MYNTDRYSSRANNASSRSNESTPFPPRSDRRRLGRALVALERRDALVELVDAFLSNRTFIAGRFARLDGPLRAAGDLRGSKRQSQRIKGRREMLCTHAVAYTVERRVDCPTNRLSRTVNRSESPADSLSDRCTGSVGGSRSGRGRSRRCRVVDRRMARRRRRVRKGRGRGWSRERGRGVVGGKVASVSAREQSLCRPRRRSRAQTHRDFSPASVPMRFGSLAAVRRVSRVLSAFCDCTHWPCCSSAERVV